jgi:single-strand DNA-binding protein
MAEYRIPSINSVVISGRATADSTLSYTEKGRAFLRFRIASSRNFRDKNTGEWREDTTFVNVTSWGKQAERLSERIKKGAPVLIEGRLSSFTQEVDGFKRTNVNITAWRIQVLTRAEAPYEEVEEEEVEEELEEDAEETKAPPDDEEELPF